LSSLPGELEVMRLRSTHPMALVTGAAVRLVTHPHNGNLLAQYTGSALISEESMKKIVVLMLLAVSLASMLGGCIIVPGGGYHHHHDYYDRY
jgi:hypothetical protein